ncbi:MAG: hypothetical protein WAL72_31405 [Streptosporangiaceae bacterium]
MQVAFNFSEDVYHEMRDDNFPVPLGVLAGEAIAELIPSHRRHCVVQVGSVTAYPESGPDRAAHAAALLKLPPRWRGYMHEKAFVETVSSGDLCAIVMDGISPRDAAAIDDRWHSSAIPGYLGSFQLLHGRNLHEALYFMTLSPRYRVYQESLSFLVDPDAVDGDGDYDEILYNGLRDALPPLGITDLLLQSRGFDGTGWDPYAVNVKFAQATGRVERALEVYTDGVIAEITLRSRTADPRLLEILDAALAMLDSSPGREHLSQTALSCRRFLERLADAVYPPRETPKDAKHKLGKAEYLNRLWAYVHDCLGPDGSKTALAEMGARIDNLAKIAHKGVHDDINVDEVNRLVLNLTLLTHDIMKLAPPAKGPAESYAQEQMDEVSKMFDSIRRNGYPDDFP